QKPFFDILDQSLTAELASRIRRPFWIDTVGRSNLVEIRIQLEQSVMRVIARRSQAYASNSHIFLAWMAGSSLVLIGVSVILLRNQIRPILRLAEAAEDFGKGRDVIFRPRGAKEVRQAGLAFLEMKNRIERAIEQRTTMLNGVSHDLRTILTRFRLSLAFLPESAELEDMKRDVDEMSRMLEAYLAFARGEAAESASPTDIRALIETFKSDAERAGHFTTLAIEGDPVVSVRPQAFRRLLGNLVSNAARYGDHIEIRAVHDEKYLTITVDDDGPGIPAESREEAFKPFLRLDASRNQDHGGTGLGLAIARDIARGHGGDVTLEESPLGGLRARVRVPA
ncbi:MAG: two-component sensor histidine kinase, partial [Methylobacterium sp.]|nr:two-component sensor histidine kinase [Methylobacterium sp.]